MDNNTRIEEKIEARRSRPRNLGGSDTRRTVLWLLWWFSVFFLVFFPFMTECLAETVGWITLNRKYGFRGVGKRGRGDGVGIPCAMFLMSQKRSSDHEAVPHVQRTCACCTMQIRIQYYDGCYQCVQYRCCRCAMGHTHYELSGLGLEVVHKAPTFCGCCIGTYLNTLPTPPNLPSFTRHGCIHCSREPMYAWWTACGAMIYSS